MSATSLAVKDGAADHTRAAAPATCGAAYDVPLAKPKPGAVASRKNIVEDAKGETALYTPTPGATSEIQEPAFENEARVPAAVDAPTASPAPPRPFDPNGCTSAAEYSPGSPSAYSSPAAVTTSAPRPTAYAIARRSADEVVE